MSNENAKSWKDVLLKSGIPLESSVRTILQNLGIKDPLEYNFLRKNIDNSVNNFSIDILAKKHIPFKKDSQKDFSIEGIKTICLEDFENYEIDYLIECKYCTPDTDWIFMPHTNSFPADNYSLCVDFFDLKREINNEYFEALYEDIPIVGKGTSLRSKGPDATQIKEAYNQLSYAYIYRLFDQYKLRFNPDTYFIIPIIVTTANLWRLNDDITIENIVESKSIEQVCTKYDVLMIQSDPDELMKKYFFERFNSLNEDMKKILEKSYYRKYRGNFEEELDAFATFTPNRFFVINYSAFEHEFKNIDNSISNPTILKKRSEQDKITL